ncbi:MAG: 50S ribosomal protein L4 [Chromatiales bacterium]|nr:50S ribosomal protein L4 [Gammaproteobacteria bacterium]MCP5352015.1 50S ribosomal protein L4 [Chromatiales bacterium]
MQMNVQGSSSAVEFADGVFGVDFNETLVHQVVVSYMAAARAGTKAQKTRSQVSGGGAKPFRQKGTGRARAGTIRSPLWKGGGVTFAATPRDHSKKVNRKMYRAALRSIWSELARQDRLVVVESFATGSPKTKEAIVKLAALGLDKGIVVASEVDENTFLATRNIPNVFVMDVASVDPASLVGADKVVVTVDALRKVEEALQ